MTDEKSTEAISPQDMQRAQAVSQAAAEAIAQSETQEEARERAVSAVRGHPDSQKLEMSDDDIEKMVDRLIEKLAELGAFSPPPVAEPAPEAQEQHAETAASAEASAAAQPPQKKTLAERFLGL